MEHHPNLRMKRIFPWLERGRRGMGRKPRENVERSPQTRETGSKTLDGYHGAQKEYSSGGRGL